MPENKSRAVWDAADCALLLIAGYEVAFVEDAVGDSFTIIQPLPCVFDRPWRLRPAIYGQVHPAYPERH